MVFQDIYKIARRFRWKIGEKGLQKYTIIIVN